jgi:uncharacterized protein YjbJ (UPF0337 family)
MEWNRIESSWPQMSSKVKEQWAKLTDDEIKQINGNRDRLEGKLVERYGYAKDKAKLEVESWHSRM